MLLFSNSRISLQIYELRISMKLQNIDKCENKTHGSACNTWKIQNKLARVVIFTRRNNFLPSLSQVPLAICVSRGLISDHSSREHEESSKKEEKKRKNLEKEMSKGESSNKSHIKSLSLACIRKTATPAAISRTSPTTFVEYTSNCVFKKRAQFKARGRVERRAKNAARREEGEGERSIEARLSHDPISVFVCKRSVAA